MDLAKGSAANRPGPRTRLNVDGRRADGPGLLLVHYGAVLGRGQLRGPGDGREFIVILLAAAIFLGGIVSPPSLLDDADAVQAQIARTMLQSGDWVTAHLDGVRYLEKAYDTVPRLYFWLFHLLWLFPWSVYFPAIAKLSFKPRDRAGRTRLLALCWAGFILIFFTFSTTQEYYSMPCYPALALLLGSAIAAGGKWVRRGTTVLSLVAGCAALAAIVLLALSRGLAAPGDISSALRPHPTAYKLSLGHIEDLTLASFAYLRLPLALAAVAFAVGSIGTFVGPSGARPSASGRARFDFAHGSTSLTVPEQRRRDRPELVEGPLGPTNGAADIFKASSERAVLAAALMMVLFFHAARLAMVAFDPYLSSRPLAEALEKLPKGTLIIDHHYYWFSSVFFYTNRSALLLNGRFMNLEYGSYAPGAPDVFIDDSQFKELWLKPERSYIVARQSALPRLQGLVGSARLNEVTTSGGKVLLTNHSLARSEGVKNSPFGPAS
jgi:hypothetical protein